MFRKMMVAVGILASVMGIAAYTARAEAGPGIVIDFGRPAYVPPVVVARPVVVAPRVVGHACCEVLYRGSCREPWRCYGNYHYNRRAYEVARSLRCQGFEARVVLH